MGQRAGGASVHVGNSSFSGTHLDTSLDVSARAPRSHQQPIFLRPFSAGSLSTPALPVSVAPAAHQSRSQTVSASWTESILGAIPCLSHFSMPSSTTARSLSQLLMRSWKVLVFRGSRGFEKTDPTSVPMVFSAVSEVAITSLQAQIRLVFKVIQRFSRMPSRSARGLSHNGQR